MFVDARETAPAAATPEAYLDKDGELDRDRAENGPWSAGIPGLPAALVHVAQRYGKLPLKTSLAPAIRIAREGFPVYARLASGYAERRDVMERYPGTRGVFLADGDAPQVGEILKQPDLARTLELLAAQGLRWLLSRRRCRRSCWPASSAEGGNWTAEELAGYRVSEREPTPLRLPRLASHHRAAAVLGRRRAGGDPADPRGLGPGQARRSHSART